MKYLRIAGGNLGKRKLVSFSNDISPTKSIVKQALFSILGNSIKGSKFLDLFAGTGAVGIEAISHEADFVCFVDKCKYSIKSIYHNIDSLNLSSKVSIYKQNYPYYLKNNKSNKVFDIVFIDPPYKFNNWVKLFDLIQLSILFDKNSLFIIETSSKVNLNDYRFDIINHRSYGVTSLYFIKYKL